MRTVSRAWLMVMIITTYAASASASEESLSYFRAYPLANRGYQYIEKQQYERAIPLFERAVAVDRMNVTYRLQLAHLLSQQGRGMEARSIISQGLLDTPKDERLLAMYDALKDEAPATKAAPASTEEKAVGEVPKTSVAKTRHLPFTPLVQQPGAEDYYAGLKLQNAHKPEEAIAAFKRALAEEPDNRLYHISLAYALNNVGQSEEAIPHFETGLKSAYDAKVSEDFAYTLKEEGYRQKAATQFRRVLDDTDDQKKFNALRRDIQQLEDEWTSYASATYRDGLARASGTPGLQSFNESMQYGFETIYSPERWQRHERHVQLYGQAFASSNTGQYAINSNTAQGAVGVRGTPLPATEWYVYGARLFAIGSQAIYDWQLRTTYAYTKGFDIDPAETWWPYVFITPDVSYLVDREEIFASIESRFGYSYRPNQYLVLTPHLVAAGAHQHNPNTSSDSVEVGPGLSVKYWFDEEVKRAPRGSAEMIFQWREGVGSTEDKSGPFVRVVLQY